MKGCVEYGYLFESRAEQIAGRDYAFDVRGIVQGRKVNAVLNAAHHFVIDQYGLSEFLAAMYDSVTYGVNIGCALNRVNARICGTTPANDVIDCRSHIPERRSQSLLRAAFDRVSNYRFASDALDSSASESAISILLDQIKVGCDDLKLDRRASAI